MTADPLDRARVEARLAELSEELARGTARLGELDAEAERHRQTLLRISGAIQALSELLAPDGAAVGAGAGA